MLSWRMNVNMLSKRIDLDGTGNFRIETSALHFAGDTLASRPATSPLLRVERRYSFRKIWNDRSRRCTIAIGHRKLKKSGATSSLSASTSERPASHRPGSD